MALGGILTSLCLEGVEVLRCSENLSSGLIRNRVSSVKHGCIIHTVGKPRTSNLRCFATNKAVPPMESDENVKCEFVAFLDEEAVPVTIFKMSDFTILDRVSPGHGGRADEMVFEAIVKDSSSPLYGTTVVLRKLATVQAQRRGKRAIEVLKKLVRQKLLYHSYSMQVHGYMDDIRGSFFLVHGYHGSFSLRHWLQQSDWLSTLENTLALDEASVKRVGDHKVGGPAVSRKLRIIRVVMRDLLIGVNYLHSHGLAHTELRLENVHISPVDRHIKVGILGNASDFYQDGISNTALDNVSDRRQMMIAFDMRCVGFMMAKMVLSELMDSSIFAKFKTFLIKGNDPSCLREFLLPILSRDSSTENLGLQILDRNWGAGWNLLSLLLASKPSKRISCLEALRHPFLCGPRWRVNPSKEMIRWGLGSTVVRITEEYIYSRPQRNRIAYFIELMEMLNPHARVKNWLQLLPGKWRFLYGTGKHIGPTLRQPRVRSLIGEVTLTVEGTSKTKNKFSFASDISYTIMSKDWPHDKKGIMGSLNVTAPVVVKPGRRWYLKKETSLRRFSSGYPDILDSPILGKKWTKVIPFKELPASLKVAKLVAGEIEVTMSCDEPSNQSVDAAREVLQEVRMQIPPELFDLSKLVCGTYLDSRLLVLRGVNGSALVFTRSNVDKIVQN